MARGILAIKWEMDVLFADPSGPVERLYVWLGPASILSFIP